MRILLALLPLLLGAFAAGAAAQPEFSEPYVARIGLGDIPTTARVEADGQVHAAQSLRVAHQAGNATEAVLFLPPGQFAEHTVCTCSAPGIVDEPRGRVTFTIPASDPTGEYVVNVTSGQDVGTAYAVTLELPAGQPGQARVILYSLQGRKVDSNLDLGEGLPSTPTNPGFTIHQAVGRATDPLPGTVWFTVHPGANVEPGAREEAPFPWVPAAIAFFAGMVVWAILVSRGVVQARSRKQHAGPAAHEQAAREPLAVLEARKRALMAGLKELEVARMANEVEPAAYDAAKAHLKKMTVTVMRAIEEGQADAKAAAKK